MTSEALAPPEVAAEAPLVGFELSPHNCFVCGELNAHGLRISIRARGPLVFADLILGPDHEGWEGIAHGGIIAALLDEVMEWSLFEAEAWGVTAEMRVRYRHPVRIGDAIHVEGWVSTHRGRRFETAARMLDAEGQVLAEAQGTYLAATAAQRAELEARYRFRKVELEPQPLGASST
ncbi:MAG TPA: PaaI family thioesterase [Candidatus Limnocylindrales bacterium]|nr:PaaI family thioesterase [Candidatus Limnocylindrales bacterium]